MNGPIRRPALARLIAASVGLSALLGACGGSPSVATVGARPVVTIQTPADGSTVAVGASVTVSGTASDTVGMDHATLFADGVSYASTPVGQPAMAMSFSLDWVAATPGVHTLQVVAYRPDGTPSDPAVVRLAVGEAASGSFAVVPGGSLPPFPSLAGGTSRPGLITPAPTKKARRTPPPATLPPTTAGTTPTSQAPTAPHSVPPTAATIAHPTPDANGYAPDDSLAEAYLITLSADNSDCPADVSGIPMTAAGCVWEQISAPAGDTADQLYFVPAANTSYLVRMISCSDTTNGTVFQEQYQIGALPVSCVDPGTGLGGWFVSSTNATPPSAKAIIVAFGTAPVAQAYTLYLLGVYQCQFANCGTQ